ncbi:MAG: PASTA domain-containing protein [Deltaproteobacteria bacterium]|nr:PASTA domain-containing protein [Deltaproteobacteria bacterium]MBW2317906.1 PASTA domain-containing protein [Deltaproteobacteria bacterium]MBW2600785.1 PASTA domain-containing protein [Deltaproteobacteria bacterium]OEU46909.1 MAG: hypothetical protein BBJ60_05035 [Desulfobacterales bacterium S7086C20]
MKRFFKIGAFFSLFGIIVAVAAYATLKLIVKSEDVVIVPDLVGKDVVYSLELLTDLGLNTKVSAYEYNADIPKNHVTYQEPGPGAEIKKDRDVRIVVSNGPQTVVVPNLIGIDVHKANIIMEGNGLTKGTISETYNNRSTAGEIIAQALAPGTLVRRGKAIDLLASLGKRPIRFEMPYLKGYSVQDAILLLEHSQLSLGQVSYVEEDNLPKDIIIRHTPLSGFPVASGSLVNLTVNRSHKPITYDKGFRLFSYHIEPGFLRKHIKFRMQAFGFVYDLVDVFAKPGQRLQVLLPYGNQAGFFVYEDDNLVLTHSSSNARPTFSPYFDKKLSIDSKEGET